MINEMVDVKKLIKKDDVENKFQQFENEIHEKISKVELKVQQAFIMAQSSKGIFPKTNLNLPCTLR